MAISAQIEVAARRALFERKMVAFGEGQLAALLAALTVQQRTALAQLIRQGDHDRIGKSFLHYVRVTLKAQADAEAAALAAKETLTQQETEMLVPAQP